MLPFTPDSNAHRTACRAAAGKRQLRCAEAYKSGHLLRGPMLQ
jgi:hypothetical protein